MNVWSCHVTYAFQSESTLYNFPECQGTPCSKKARNLKFKWLQLDWNPQPLSSKTNTQPFSQNWPVWVNGWKFVYELSGRGFESSCIHLNNLSPYLITASEVNLVSGYVTQLQLHNILFVQCLSKRRSLGNHKVPTFIALIFIWLLSQCLDVFDNNFWSFNKSYRILTSIHVRNRGFTIVLQ